MDNKAFRYIYEFIKANYELHYDSLSKDILKTSIFSDVYEKYGTEKICNGEADKFLIQLINEYIKNNCIEDLSDYENFKLYIKGVVTHKKSFLTSEKHVELLDYVVEKIAIELVNEKEYSIDLDKKIISIFDNYINVIYNDIDSYISDLLKLSFVEVRVNVNTFLYLKKELISKCLKEKGFELVLTGIYDNDLLEDYEELILNYKKKVKGYIQRYIHNLPFPFDISESLIIADISRKIFETGEFDLEKLFNGGLNSYIVSHGKELLAQQRKEQAVRKIYGLISQNGFGKQTSEALSDYSFEIFRILREKYNYSVISILNGSHDDLILSLYNRILMKKNSVVDKKEPKKIKHETVKKKFSPVLKWLLVITLLISVTASAFSIADIVDYSIASSKVSDFDGYFYTSIYAADNDRVEPTGKNAYEFYKKVVSAGFNDGLYGYLSFYKAYTLVHQDRLFIMDRIMNEAKWEAHQYEDEVSQDFYRELSKCSCFLEFAMRRLDDLGCNEISKNKYKNALKEYESAMHKDDKPMNIVSLEAKESIEEIMNLYRKYSKEQINDFGDLLETSANIDDYMLLSVGGHSRRNV